MKIETFRGSRKDYKAWKKFVEAQQELYSEEQGELAMLVYLSVKGETRDTLDQLELNEMKARGGLKKIWSLLDEAYGEADDELFEKAEQ